MVLVRVIAFRGFWLGRLAMGPAGFEVYSMFTPTLHSLIHMDFSRAINKIEFA